MLIHLPQVTRLVSLLEQAFKPGSDSTAPSLSYKEAPSATVNELCTSKNSLCESSKVAAPKILRQSLWLLGVMLQPIRKSLGK